MKDGCRVLRAADMLEEKRYQTRTLGDIFDRAEAEAFTAEGRLILEPGETLTL